MASTPSSTVAGGTIAPVMLPATGFGFAPISSISILVLLALSAVMLTGGAISALLGRRPPVVYEDDGITMDEEW